MSANWIFSFVSPDTQMSALHPFEALEAQVRRRPKADI
jgi:hypothetical protein